jgi:beta-lactamase superfamily II metal-dependent hydrolase
VGQGDAALIRSPAGRTVLVDGGPPQADDLLLRRLPALVQGPLDLVVLTHPHLDHLGGLPRVLQGVGARRFLDPGFEQPSESYRDLLALLARLKIPLRQPTLDPARPGQPVTIGLGEGASLTVLWPRRPVEPFLANTRSDANANSVVMRLTHGNVHVLFTGDAEPDTEERLLELGAPLRAQVLKVGHHGSRWASSAPFLAQVRPEVAVISAGRGNDYGHPTPEALERLRAVGARVLRTDLAGELRLESDGTRVRVEPVGPAPPAAPGGGTPQAPAPAPGYTAYRGGPVFHRADCRAAAKWTPAQREDFSRREDAARGRRPAKDCDP